MSLEQTIGNLEIRYANVVTFVGSSNTMVDTTTGRIQTKGIQHNSNVITDVSGPHGRIAPTLKKYPEIIFEEGKMDENRIIDTYAQAGYTVSASSFHTNATRDYHTWKAFDGSIANNAHAWLSGYVFSNGSDYNAVSDGTGDELTGIVASSSGGVTSRHGAWLQLELPCKIKLSEARLYGRYYVSSDRIDAGYIYGSNSATSWTQIGEISASGISSGNLSTYTDVTPLIIKSTDTTNSYKYFIVQPTSLTHSSRYAGIGQMEYYGIEEYTPAGDHSVDTTFKSRFNNPQTTGVQVLVDGATGVGTNQISGGPNPSGNDAPMTSPNKYWTLNGTLTSNLAVEANTFLEGDQPHAVSVWFNSSNLEANVSNTCVFSISDQEHLNSQNLDLQSNTWHNLTYAYQGEGGSRVTYLDGRKVAEDQAEDTFGEYPPFAMTGFSQGGYVASSSSYFSSQEPYRAFDHSGAGGGSVTWTTTSITNLYGGGSGLYGTVRTSNLGLDTGGTATPQGGTRENGEWITLQVPNKITLSYISISRVNDDTTAGAKDFQLYGSNDGKTWVQILSVVSADPSTTGTSYTLTSTPVAYTYFGLVVTRTISRTGYMTINDLIFYGHRENDLVRLPDPTNVLKYPHVVMTGPAQRGYVASANEDQANYEAYEAFNNLVSSSAANFHHWTSPNLNYDNNGDFTAGTAPIHTTNVGGTSKYGNWCQIELPHKLKYSYSRIRAPYHHIGRQPREGYIVGSNDLSGQWTILHNFSGVTRSAATDYSTYTPSSAPTQYFKYIRIVIEKLGAGAGSAAYAGIDEWEIYGTGVDSIPIQIGGGNIDKIANFRVYDKFIGEDQALEIWNAQKEEFGRAKPQMVLQQGKLGIGTDAPQGSLSVADEPHNLEEFPPRAMTGYKTHFEGHGEFCVSASDEHSSNYDVQNAFNKITNRLNSSGGTTNTYYNGGEPTPRYYDVGNDYAYSGTSSTHGLGGVMGEWVKLEFPYKANISQISILPVDVQISTLAPEDFTIMGSSDDINWTTLRTVTGATWTAHNFNEYTLPSTTSYKYFALVVSRTVGSNQLSIQELKYFGTREQGQSVLHDGQLTLTKNLTVPRIGPALDADDTPRRDRLVVEYNTSTNPTFEGAVRDTSGRGNDGVFYGDALYDATEKAFTFSGTDPSIHRVRGLGSSLKGNQQLSASFWTRINEDVDQGFFSVGDTSVIGKCFGFRLDVGSSNYNLEVSYSGSAHSSLYRYKVTDLDTPNDGKWRHFVVINAAGTKTANGTTYDYGATTAIRLFLNGVELYTMSSSTYINGVVGSASDVLNLDPNPTLSIGSFFDGAYDMRGSISNFKLYDTALTVEEAKTLYDMGRCDEGHHTTTVSRSQLRMGGENLVIEPCIKGFYEEGTWSPYIAGSTSGVCYPSGSNYGWFIRVGNLVTIGGTVAWSGYSGAISGNRQIMGLPYPARNVPNARTAMSFGVTASTGLYNALSGGTTFRLIIDPGFDFIYIADSIEVGGQYSDYSIGTTLIDSTGVIYGIGGTYRI